jgi:hypothetical protein
VPSTPRRAQQRRYMVLVLFRVHSLVQPQRFASLHRVPTTLASAPVAQRYLSPDATRRKTLDRSVPEKRHLDSACELSPQVG